MPVPTGRLALAAALLSLLVVAMPLAAPVGLVVANGALLLVAAADWALAPAPGRVAVERDLPAVLPLGGNGEVTWTVHNPLARPLRLGLADDLAPSLRAGTRPVRLTVPGRGAAFARTPIRPSRR